MWLKLKWMPLAFCATEFATSNRARSNKPDPFWIWRCLIKRQCKTAWRSPASRGFCTRWRTRFECQKVCPGILRIARPVHGVHPSRWCCRKHWHAQLARATPDKYHLAFSPVVPLANTPEAALVGLEKVYKKAKQIPAYQQWASQNNQVLDDQSSSDFQSRLVCDFELSKSTLQRLSLTN